MSVPGVSIDEKIIVSLGTNISCVYDPSAVLIGFESASIVSFRHSLPMTGPGGYLVEMIGTTVNQASMEEDVQSQCLPNNAV